MTDTIDKFILPAAFALLPVGMNSPQARAMLLAIGLQETKFKDRVQRVPGSLRSWWSGGPARSFWQFEQGGLGGVLASDQAGHLRRALTSLAYAPDMPVGELHGVIAHNDVVAAVCARLLLRTDPRPLPSFPAGAEPAWQCYVRNWRPGKPHRETWAANWRDAWRRVNPTLASAA